MLYLWRRDDAQCRGGRMCYCIILNCPLYWWTDTEARKEVPYVHFALYCLSCLTAIALKLFLFPEFSHGTNRKKSRRSTVCVDLGFHGRSRDVRIGVLLRFGARARGDNGGRGTNVCIHWLSGNHRPSFGTTTSRCQSEQGDTQVPFSHHDHLRQGISWNCFSGIVPGYSVRC